MNTTDIPTTNMNALNINTIHTSTVKRKTTTKKYFKNSDHKTHVCIFCKKEFSRLAEHFTRRHRNEDKVKDIIATTDKQAKMWKWKTLRQQGDHFFNVTENLGDRKLVKVPTRASNKSKYFNCPVCFARLRTCSKFEHKLVCKNVFKTNVDSDFKEINKDIFVRMPESLINKIRKSSYVNGFLKQTFEAGETNRNFRNTCKDIIYLEEEMQKTTGENKPLSCFLTSTHVDDLIKIIRNVGGQIKCGKERSIMRYPFRVQRFCRMITRFSRYLTAYYSKRNLDRDLAEITKFLNAFQLDSEKLLHKQARRAIRIKQQLTPKRLPKTSDIKILVRKLTEETPKMMNALRMKSNRRTWRTLAENVLCRLTIFNRRRGGGVENMKISDYTRTEVRLKTVTEESTYNLSPEDREFLENVRIVEILHKCDNVIPIYITKELQEPMDMLLEYRKYADDLHENNDYFFAAGKNSLTPIRGVKVLERYRQILPDRIKKYFTATSLRKHGATVAQVLDLTLQDKEEWAAHMGHSVQVHNKYYKMSEQVSAVLKTGRILTALNEGAMKYYKGKKISEIPLKTKEHKIKASDFEISEEPVIITQAEEYANEAGKPTSSSPSSYDFASTGEYKAPPPTTKSLDKDSTLPEDGAPVTLILVCNTPFSDLSGRTYVNLIPVTVTPSLYKEITCPDQTPVSTPPPIPNKNHANEIPVTGTPSLNTEARPLTQQVAVQTMPCPEESITPFQDQNARPYVNLVPLTVILSPNDESPYVDENAAPTTPFPDNNLGSYVNVIPISTTTPLNMEGRSCTHQIVTASYSLDKNERLFPGQNATQTTTFPHEHVRCHTNETAAQTIPIPDENLSYNADKTTLPTKHFSDKNSKSNTDGTFVTNTPSTPLVEHENPSTVQSVSTTPHSDKSGNSFANLISLVTSSENIEALDSAYQISGLPTFTPDDVAKLNALRSSVIVPLSQIEDEPYHQDEIPVTTTSSLPDKAPNSGEDDDPVIISPIPEGNVRSDVNEISVIIGPSATKDAKSDEDKTPTTASTPPGETVQFFDGAIINNTTTTTTTPLFPDKDASSCNDKDNDKNHGQSREKKKRTNLDRQQTPTRKKTKSPASRYDDDWKRMRRKYLEGIYSTRGKPSGARRVLVYDSDSDGSAKEDYHSLPVKKRLSKRYFCENVSNDSDGSTGNTKVKPRKKRPLRQSTMSRSTSSHTPTKKAKTRKPAVRVTLKLPQKENDENLSGYSSNSSDSSAFF